MHRVLEKLSAEGIAYLYAQGGGALRSSLELYYTRLREAPLRINGEDLIRLGLPPSSRYSEILKEVERASLDGVATTRKSQLAMARKLSATMAGEREAERAN